MLQGIAAAPGAVVGRALVYQPIDPVVEVIHVSATEVPAEIERFYMARELALQQLQRLQVQAEKRFGKEAGAIFVGHRLLAEDEALEMDVLHAIREEKHSAAAATEHVFQENITAVEELQDPYLQARAADIRALKERFLRHLLGLQTVELSILEEPCILVARELTPADIAQLNVQVVLGIVMEGGSITAHTAILARSVELPALVGAEGALQAIRSGDLLALDAVHGRLFIHPNEEEKQAVLEIAAARQQRRASLRAAKQLASVTVDGKTVRLAANIGSLTELALLRERSIEAIGLYRTEFLFMDRKALPDEEDQYRVYKELAASDLQEVVIRTLDVGGDKPVAYLDLPQELNPFLGWRAIRIGLDQRSLLQTQLRAILRASAHGPVRMLIPMIATLEELRQVKEEVAKAKASLSEEGLVHDPNLPLGIMVEIPAVAVMADVFAKEVDFFSIGTNDLIQYTLAVDRGNERVAHLYSGYDPAVLRLIQMTVQGAHAANIPVCMCGELAGDPQAVSLLVGLGIDQLSMNPSRVWEIKERVRSISSKEAEAFVVQILQECSEKGVKGWIEEAETRRDERG